MTKTNALPVVLRWVDSNANKDCKVSWRIFGIHSNGSFWGEIKLTFPRRDERGFAGEFVGMEGNLSETDNAKFKELVAAIVACGEKNNYGGVDHKFCEGQIGWGPRSKLRILFKYSVAGLVDSKGAVLFQRVVSLLEPYMRNFYPTGQSYLAGR